MGNSKTKTTAKGSHSSPEGSGTDGRPVFARTHVLGLWLLAAMQVVLMVAAIAPTPAMAGEVLAFFLPVLAATLLAIWLVSRYPKWGLVAGIAATLLSAGLMLADTLKALTPSSPANLILGVGVPLGVVLGMAGGIGALASARRGRTAVSETSLERSIRMATLALMGMVAVAAVPLFFMGRDTVDVAAAAGAVPVEMIGFEFEPTEINVDSSNPRLLVRNRDGLLHDLTVPELDVLVRVNPGSSTIVELPQPASGTYVVACTIHTYAGTVDSPEEGDMAAVLAVH